MDLITNKVPLKDYLKIYNNLNESNSIASILVYPGLIKMKFLKISKP